MDDKMTDTANPIDPRVAGLADGSLTGARREAVEAEVQASPQLRAELREQERAVRLVRATDAIVAPASLRASIDELTAPSGGRRRASSRRQLRLFAPAMTVIAVIVVALVVGLHGSSAPTVPQTARLALAAATTGPPAERAGNHDLLAAHVGAVTFPSYEATIGWKATGSRRDTLHGRRVMTVFYRAPHGTRVGYSIVSGKTLTALRGPAATVGGVRYVFGHVGTAKLVTWWRDGHTCVIAGRTVGRRALLALAAADAHA